VIAFTVSLTPDIAVNHKYVMISIFLLNIPAAYALTVLFTQKNRLRWPGRAAALALAFALTATGVFDHFAMYHKNKEGQRYQVELNGRTEEWIATNTEPGDVFASHIHWMSPVFLAGRFAFMGWPYYPWSAGYDTLAREDALKKFFAAEDGRVLQTLARLYRVSYVLADGALRESADFEFNEALFDETFEVVFYDEETDIKIYRVQNLRS
ncbi:MAG: hypothetical protein LBR83_07340, partial [Clostridiales bacterium]|nr:hypothetical protein [Clostridiales bacterium]